MKFKVQRDCWNMYVPTRSPQRKRLRLLVGKSVSYGQARLIRKGQCHQTRVLYSTSSEDLKTSTQSLLDAMAKSVKALNETVEAGVNPEKSLKRKFQEYQEQQRVEDQKKEEARLQKEQEDQERQQLDYDPSLHRSPDAVDGRAKGTVHS